MADLAQLRCLISGASGFIGRRVLHSLQRQGATCRVLSRVQTPLDEPGRLLAVCAGQDCVIHCAGYAHAFTVGQQNDARLHWHANYAATRNLAEAAGRGGVKKFIFLSSVKAMGEPGENCIDEDYPVPPDSPYGQAKRAAEEALVAIGRRHGMEITILRPSLVYGAGSRGNLERMGRLIQRGWFPPLPETGNRRSLVHVDDVVNAIETVLLDPRAAGGTYIVTGPEAPSGRALYLALCTACGRRPKGWHVPAAMLEGAAKAAHLLECGTGQPLPFNRQVVERLLKSACYRADRIHDDLGWKACIGLRQGLAETFGTVQHV